MAINTLEVSKAITRHSLQTTLEDARSITNKMISVADILEGRFQCHRTASTPDSNMACERAA